MGYLKSSVFNKENKNPKMEVQRHHLLKLNQIKTVKLYQDMTLMLRLTV